MRAFLASTLILTLSIGLAASAQPSSENDDPALLQTLTKTPADNAKEEVELYEAAIKAGMADPGVYVRSAKAHYRLGNYAMAAERAKQALERSPNNREAFVILKLTQGYAKTPGSRVLKVPGGADGGLRPPIAEISRRIKAQDYPGAVAGADRELEKDPYDADALGLRAAARVRMGDSSGALEDCRKLVLISPGNAKSYLVCARVKEALGDAAGMIEDYRAAAKLDPEFTPLYERALGRGSNSPAKEPGRRDRRRWILTMVVIGGVLVILGITAIVPWKGKGDPPAEDEVLDAEEAPEDEEPVPSGRIWTEYRFLRRLDEGSMGKAFQAEEKSSGRVVVIKEVRAAVLSNPEARRAFQSKVRAAGELKHDGILPVHALKEFKDRAYVVVQFRPGKTLRQLLKEKGTLKLGEARKLFYGVCEALSYAHEKKVIHGDLKPSNILIDEMGKARVMDFAYSREAKDSLMRLATSNTVFGTTLYLAPEQEEGSPVPQSDTYSLGLCLYEAVVGKRPFTGSPGAVLVKKTKGEYVPPTEAKPGLPRQLDALIANALHPEPGKRYSDPKEMMGALDQAVFGGAGSAA